MPETVTWCDPEVLAHRSGSGTAMSPGGSRPRARSMARQAPLRRHESSQRVGLAEVHEIEFEPVPGGGRAGSLAALCVGDVQELAEGRGRVPAAVDQRVLPGVFRQEVVLHGAQVDRAVRAAA